MPGQRSRARKGCHRNRTMNEPSTLDINGVMKYLPHRYPFLLVDRVLEFVSGKSLRALYRGGWGRPGGLLASPRANVIRDKNPRFFFGGIDRAGFRKPVEPGD